MSQSNKNTNFSIAFPNTILCCQSQLDKKGPEDFFKAFGKTWDNCGGYEPLLLASNYSGGGELAQTYGLFKKNKQLYDVYGTECSIWNFNGQWELEQTTVEEVLHKIVKGDLGHDDGYGQTGFANELKSLMVSMLEQRNAINYSTATPDQKFILYSKQFEPHELARYNIIYDSIIREFSYIDNNRYVIKPEYMDTFKEIFKDYLLPLEDEYQTYSFSSANVNLFIKLSANNEEGLLVSHKDIHNKNLDVFSLSFEINNVLENIALSLLEKKDLCSISFNDAYKSDRKKNKLG